MSSTIFCLIALVFLMRFDSGYCYGDDSAPVIVFIVAFVMAACWDISRLLP